MPLTIQEKHAIAEQLAALVDAGEPEAMLATLQRTAVRMARRITRASITDLEAMRWNALAEACEAVAKELERANAPTSAQQPQHAPQSAPEHAPEPDETPSAA